MRLAGRVERRVAAARRGRARDVRRAVARAPSRRGADRPRHQRRPRRDLDRATRFATLLERPSATARPRCDGYAALAEMPDEELGAARDAGRARLVGDRPRAAAHAVARARACGAQLGWPTTCSTRTRSPSASPGGSPTYKRPTLLLSRPGAARARCCTTAERPVQFVFAGKAHPADDAGQGADPADRRSSPREPDVRHRIVFLEDYDMAHRPRCWSAASTCG